MLRGLIEGLGWKQLVYSGGEITYQCIRPLWSLIHGLNCWMSEAVLRDFGLSDSVDSNNYCAYVVNLQNEIGKDIWNSEALPNSLVYRPDNPNFTESDELGFHYHIHIFHEFFEGGKGFPMGNSSIAAPLWQGFNIYKL
ncbi:MAG: hypothetical protein BGO68_06205 [Candidatus Amoebophilus sp. 36-38]|nr:MAG: hypothetical protein BGO68_06205 [Candidatus Amoebophilus sp. 36-38]